MRKLVVLLALAASSPAFAADLPPDVQGHVDRRKACNYWLGETADRHSLRKHEIEHHLRLLQCGTLAHEEVVLRTRYRGNPVLLDAMDQADDALPDN